MVKSTIEQDKDNVTNIISDELFKDLPESKEYSIEKTSVRKNKNCLES